MHKERIFDLPCVPAAPNSGAGEGDLAGIALELAPRARISLSLGAFLLGLAGLLGFPLSARATDHGDYVNADEEWRFENVVDENGLFGAFSGSGLGIQFDADSPAALSCSSCPEGAFLSDVLSFDLRGDPDLMIPDITLHDNFEYDVHSPDPIGFASTYVTADVRIEIWEVDGQTIDSISRIQSMLFSPLNNGSVFGIDSFSGPMRGTLEIGMNDLIRTLGITGNVTGLSVDYAFSLHAFHDGFGGQASIERQSGGGNGLRVELSRVQCISCNDPPYNPMPEPSTAVLLLGGLIGLSCRARAA